MGTRPGYSIILILLFNKIIPMNKNCSQSSIHFILHLNLSPGLPQRFVPRSKIKHNTMLGKRLLARYEVHFIFITSTLDWFYAWIRRIPSPLRTFSRMKIEYFISFDPSWLLVLLLLALLLWSTFHWLKVHSVSQCVYNGVESRTWPTQELLSFSVRVVK